MSSSVPGRQGVLSAACQSQVQIGLDKVFQISVVLTSPHTSDSLHATLLDTMKCSCRQMFLPPQILWKRALFMPSLLIRKWGCGAFIQRAPKATWSPRPPLQTLGENEQGFVCSVLGRGG